MKAACFKTATACLSTRLASSLLSQSIVFHLQLEFSCPYKCGILTHMKNKTFNSVDELLTSWQVILCKVAFTLLTLMKSTEVQTLSTI